MKTRPYLTFYIERDNCLYKYVLKVLFALVGAFEDRQQFVNRIPSICLNQFVNVCLVV